MRILVPLHPLLDPVGFVVNRRAGRVFVNREEFVTDPADRCALEAALLIRDSTGAEIIAASVGPARNETVLREALALRASRAFRLDINETDDGLAACALARLAERVGGIDLVLMGSVALDTGDDSLGPRLAEALGWPFIGRAWRIEVSGEMARAVQAVDGKWIEVEARLPAVVALAPGTLKPRFPNGARLLNEFKATDNVTVLTAEELGLTDAAVRPAVNVTGKVFPPERELGRRMEGTLSEIASALAPALL